MSFKPNRARLVEGKDRLAVLPSLPLTELTAMAQVAELL